MTKNACGSDDLGSSGVLVRATTPALFELVTRPALEERDRCPVCEAASSATVYSSPFLDDPVRSYLERHYSGIGGQIDFSLLAGASFRVERCASCELLWQRFAPNDEFAKIVYEEWIAPEQSLRISRARARVVWTRKLYTARLMTILDLLPEEVWPPVLLDFGMGWGELLHLALAWGFEAHGTDLASSRQDHANAAVGAAVLDLEGALSLNVDVLHSDQVFEHVPAPGQLIEGLGGALRPSAVAFLGVPNGSRLASQFDRADWTAAKGTRWSMNAISPLEHLNCYTTRSLTCLAERARLAPAVVPFGTYVQSIAAADSPSDAAKRLVRSRRVRHQRFGTALYFRHR